MSIDHVSRVLRLPASVNGTNRMVLFVLAEAANQDTDECWPSTATIAKRAGIRQEKYVAKAVAALVDLGLIDVHPNGCPDVRIRIDRRPNLYRMVGDMAVIDGGARRADGPSTGVRDAPDGGARRAATGVRDAPTLPLIEPEVEPEVEPRSDLALIDDAATFDDFYRVYPRKKEPHDARRAWDKAIRSTLPAAIIAGARQFAVEREGEDPKFTPYPASWLNAGGWKNEPDMRTGPKVSKSTKSLASWAERRGAAEQKAVGR